MLLRIPTKDLRTLVAEGIASEKTKANTTLAGRKLFADFDSDELTRKELKALFSYCDDTDTRYANNLSFLLAMRRGDATSMPITEVAAFHTLLLQTLTKSRLDGYIYKRGDFGALYPYLVTNVTLNERPSSAYETKGFRPSVTISLAYSDHIGNPCGDEIHVPESTFQLKERKYNTKGDFLGYTDVLETYPHTVEQVLERSGFYLETAELQAAYQRQLDRFVEYAHRYGEQFLGRGTGAQTSSPHTRAPGARASESRWGYSYSSNVPLKNRDGSNAKLILDCLPLRALHTGESESGDDDDSYSRRYHKRRNPRRVSKNSEVDMDSYYDEEGNMIRHSKEDFFQMADVYKPLWPADQKVGSPVHLTLQVFHLESHASLTVHVNSLKPYKYNPDLVKSLVLDTDTKELVRIIAMSTIAEEEDLTENKTAAKVVLCKGDPGTGKTLTAEVVSELVGKPLYKIEAAHLGIDAETIEANLRTHLLRTEQWGAIMLIDEANSYIHARGQDPNQNAVVGVFLRLLDFYRGILFLTTNKTGPDGKSIDVDEAITQRCIAVIDYSIPSGKYAKQIWQVHSNLLSNEAFPIALTKEDLDFLESHCRLSGRGIRNLLRLTRTVCLYKEKQFSLDELRRCSRFTPLTTNERIDWEKTNEQ